MSRRTSGVPDGSNRNRIMFVIVAIILIGSFLWRLLTPAYEYPMRTEQLMTIGLDLILLVALIGLKRTTPGFAVLFWIALVAGIGLFAIRLNGSASWWTGHLVYVLPR